MVYDEPSATCWCPEDGSLMAVQLYVLIIIFIICTVLNYKGKLHTEIFLIRLILERCIYKELAFFVT